MPESEAEFWRKMYFEQLVHYTKIVAKLSNPVPQLQPQPVKAPESKAVQ